MKLFRPVKTNRISQGYGIMKTARELLPLYNSLGLEAHDGIDFGVNCKDYSVIHGNKCELVYCNIDTSATITYIQKSDEWGYGINAISDDGKHRFCWWHFDYINPDLKEFSQIEGGTVLGAAGKTGKGTSCHVHFGVYENGKEQNRYKGAIDPEPFYENVFILDFINDLKGKIGIMQKLIELWQKIKSLL
jgi:hypothetical protein